MAAEPSRPDAPEPTTETAEVSAEQLSRAAEFIEEEEGAFSHFPGLLATATKFLLVAMSLFHLYAAVDIVPANVLRPVHVGWMLLLVFLLVPVSARYRNRLMWWDVACALLGVATIAYLLAGGDEFWDRNTTPSTSDAFFGVAFVLLVLEACRRTSGWIMVFVIGSFLAYAFAGPWLPGQWAHRGYDVDGMTGFLYQTLEGIFGTAVDVSSTLIILFTIYGAFLQLSGAGKFFLDWSFAAMGGKHTGAGRTVVMASFLLGGPSGSGVATTVTIGSVAYPMLKRSGYGPEAAGGLLAAGGLGAIISPPVLGAAAFLIAEFLKISYLDVLLMAVVPTILYYLSLFLMVELDARKFRMPAMAAAAKGELARLTGRYWYHFLSLASIVVFMLVGFSPILSVFWATIVTLAASWLRRETAMGPRKARRRAVRRLAADAERRRDLRRGRDHRRRRGEDGSGPQVQRHRHRLRRGQPLPHRALYGADRLGDRPGGAGDRELHHLRGDRRAGADQAGRAGLRGAHVHLLLRGAFRSVAADGT